MNGFIIGLCINFGDNKLSLRIKEERPPISTVVLFVSIDYDY